MFRSIIVDVGFESLSTSRVQLAADLAKQFDAGLTGFSAATVQPPIVTEVGALVQMPLLNNSIQTIQEQLGKLEAEFRMLAPDAGWVGDVDEPTSALAREASAADLVVTGAGLGAGLYNSFAAVNGGDLAIQAGRPILIVPQGVSEMTTDRVLVAWKDTREARRSIRDALPFLTRAQTVTLAGVVEGNEEETGQGLARALKFLSVHGVQAKVQRLERHQRSSGERILEAARLADAQMIVSGAYGHSRFREWVFGGVTRSLLEDRGTVRFMSG